MDTRDIICDSSYHPELFCTAAGNLIEKYTPITAEVALEWTTDKHFMSGAEEDIQKLLTATAKATYRYGFIRIFGIKESPLKLRSSIRYEYQAIPGPFA